MKFAAAKFTVVKGSSVLSFIASALMTLVGTAAPANELRGWGCALKSGPCIDRGVVDQLVVQR